MSGSELGSAYILLDHPDLGVFIDARNGVGSDQAAFGELGLELVGGNLGNRYGCATASGSHVAFPLFDEPSLVAEVLADELG